MPRPSAASAEFLVNAAERLRPPSSLSAEQKREFTSVVLSLPSYHFQQSERPLVVRYARARRRAARFRNAGS
jgi:hypothetical protein